MPCNYKRDYPENWKEIRQEVGNRANGKCEWCGAANGEPNPKTGSKVVLTIAHLDHDLTHNDLTNLACLCQLCHLRYDARLHAEHASHTRAVKQETFGQEKLL